MNDGHGEGVACLLLTKPKEAGRETTHVGGWFLCRRRGSGEVHAADVVGEAQSAIFCVRLSTHAKKNTRKKFALGTRDKKLLYLETNAGAVFSFIH